MLKWNGEELKAKKDRAAQWAIDKVMSECIKEAKDTHTWINRTGTAEGSIQMRVATMIDGVITGIWGFFNLIYPKFLEIGTSKMPARPVLRPTADKHYPTLAKKFKEAMQSDSKGKTK